MRLTIYYNLMSKYALVQYLRLNLSCWVECDKMTMLYKLQVTVLLFR